MSFQNSELIPDSLRLAVSRIDTRPIDPRIWWGLQSHTDGSGLTGIGVTGCHLDDSGKENEVGCGMKDKWGVKAACVLIE